MRGLLLIAALAAGPALAQAGIDPTPAGRAVPPPAARVGTTPAGAGDGRALFGEKCAMCHGPGGMGTALLARRMDPDVALLEKRADLTPAYIRTAVRTGIGNMPWISRGEVSDRQLAAIAAYLAKGNR